ncbi:inovirus-type Gp2 protein [Terasakiella sp. A23]|uniref:YagK/YfjJ domain-containing protein n=1 Tax=Terasakiella sp. FCG-A23 TaxID=3080561 RepID=UPI00295298A1|nr:inovirus-type Gp2 protein [Terasakiella sp. A23]MDV7341820.1 inovirus-type Gp2 protein [Terasakiella sp. A23]
MRKSDQNRTRLFDINSRKLLNGAIDQHRRLLPVRIDLRFQKGYIHDGQNKEISKFHKNICQHYRDQGIRAYYHTVREQVTSNNPHYHVMLFLDGDKVRSVRHVQKQCCKIWNGIVGYNMEGLVNYCTPKPEYQNYPLRMIYRPSSKATGEELERQTTKFEKAKEIVEQHASYLNKEAGKGRAPHRVREVFTSQIKKT